MRHVLAWLLPLAQNGEAVFLDLHTYLLSSWSSLGLNARIEQN